MNDEIFFNIIGIAGGLCFLAAFTMLQMEKQKGDDYLYLFLNLVGAVLLDISLIYDWNLAAFLLETVWAVVSMYGLAKRWRKGRAA